MKKITTSFIFSILLIAIGSNAQNSSPYWSISGNNNESGTSKLGTTNKISLHFYTNNLQRMFIDSSSGRVGIGTTVPQDRLHVNSVNGENPFRAQVNGTTRFLVYNNGGVSIGTNTNPPSTGLFVLGNTGLGTNTPAYKLDVNGTAGIRNTLTITDGGIVSTNSTGDAFYGLATSTYGYGVAGVSNYLGAFGSGATYGVYGDATGTSGYGVYGSGYDGVYGVGSNYGVYAYGNLGLYATSTTGGYEAIEAYSTGSSNYGIYAYSASSLGIYAGTGNTSTYAGYFGGNIYCTGTYLGSDAKLKKNITTVDNAMDIINKLQPKNYEYRNDSSYAKMNLPEGKHYGFIAQDIETVLPNLVKESHFDVARTNPDETPPQAATARLGKKADIVPSKRDTKEEAIDFKAVNYTELIPIMVKALQEQQTLIKDLQSQVNDLKLLISKGNNTTITSLSSGYLKQNVPNPAGNSTVISYYLPDETFSAQIMITDAKGSVVKTYSASKGQGQLNVSNGELAAGVYNFTLYANNKVVDSKQMIIAR